MQVSAFHHDHMIQAADHVIQDADHVMQGVNISSWEDFTHSQKIELISVTSI